MARISATMSRKKKRNNKKQQNDLNLDPALAEVIECFSACGRCSYFWAGYRVIAGEEAILTAVQENDPVWLNLPWSHPVRELVLKSYGVRFDVDYFHHEGSCKECQRQFVYYEDDEDERVADEVESVADLAGDEDTTMSELVTDGVEVSPVEAEAESDDSVSFGLDMDEAEDSEPEKKVFPTSVHAHFKIERMPCVSKA